MASEARAVRYGGTSRTIFGIPRLYLRENFEGWLFVAPAVLGVLSFSLFPVVYSLYASMTQWDAVNLPTWVGIDNYVTMLTRDTLFWRVFGNTLYYALGSVPPRIVLGLVLALLVNRKLRGVTWYRTAYFAPVVTNVIAIGIVFAWIYAPDYGLVNVVLSAFGIQGPSWLSDSVSSGWRRCSSGASRGCGSSTSSGPWATEGVTGGRQLDGSSDRGGGANGKPTRPERPACSPGA